MIFLLVPAGWKLTPMVGAMYSPELYTGMTKGLTSTGDKINSEHRDVGAVKEALLSTLPPSVPGFPYPAAAAAASTAATFRGAHLRGRARPVYSAVRAAVPQPAIPTYPG